MVLPVRSYPLREQQPWIPPHISLMAFTSYFHCCSQNNFFGSCIFLHSAACVTTLILTEGIWDYVLSCMKVRASVFTIRMKSFLFLQSSQGPGLSAGRKGGYHIGLLMQLSGHASMVHKGGQERERNVASYLSQPSCLALLLLPPCSKNTQLGLQQPALFRTTTWSESAF